MAVRFDAGGDDLRRTASLPTAGAFTICGWGRMTTDTNAFATLCSLESGTVSAANFLLLSTDADGTALKLWNTGGVSAGTLATLAVGTTFFWAMTASGTGAGQLSGYYRTVDANTLSSITHGGTSFTTGALFIANDSFTEPFNGRIWGVKVWDRALSAAELLAESYFDRPLFPTSLNCWWPLPNASDTTDKSGNARNPTVTGTLTTEDSTSNLWRARQRLFVPASAGGVTSGDLDIDSIATLTGSGASAADGAISITSTATLTGSGASVVSAAASIAATATPQFSGVELRQAAMDVSSTAVFTMAGASTASGAVDIDGVSSVIFGARSTNSGAADIDAISDVQWSSADSNIVSAAASITATATLNATGAVTAAGSVDINAQAVITMTGAATVAADLGIESAIIFTGASSSSAAAQTQNGRRKARIEDDEFILDLAAMLVPALSSGFFEVRQ